MDLRGQEADSLVSERAIRSPSSHSAQIDDLGLSQHRPNTVVPHVRTGLELSPRLHLDQLKSRWGSDLLLQEMVERKLHLAGSKSANRSLHEL